MRQSTVALHASADSNDRAQLFQSDAAQRSNLIARMWKPPIVKGNWHYREPVVKRLPKRSRLMLMVSLDGAKLTGRAPPTVP
ncbi:hypothetical protein CQ10_37335 [Bradyrhizobium valentinum]|nr:hypothetical protein CQ10_37335 [Bradyrhizobium valentinum]